MHLVDRVARAKQAASTSIDAVEMGALETGQQQLMTLIKKVGNARQAHPSTEQQTSRASADEAQARAIRKASATVQKLQAAIQASTAQLASAQTLSQKAIAAKSAQINAIAASIASSEKLAVDIVARVAAATAAAAAGDAAH